MFLAFLVAAMPNPARRHYYFEIMLPGSILGAVVGCATQRYKRCRDSAGLIIIHICRKKRYAVSDSFRDSCG